MQNLSTTNAVSHTVIHRRSSDASRGKSNPRMESEKSGMVRRVVSGYGPKKSITDLQMSLNKVHPRNNQNNDPSNVSRHEGYL